jgi:hypothetical protein
MIQVTSHMRIVVAVDPVDFRNGIDGLVRVCKEVLKADPFAGWLFKCPLDCTRFDRGPSSGEDNPPVSSTVRQAVLSC